MLTRIATINDVEQLRVLYKELEYDAVKYQPEHFVVGYREDTFFINIFNSANQNIIVADDNGKIVGFSHVMILEQKAVSCLKPQSLLYIQDLEVAVNERNKSIGTHLMQAIKRYGEEYNVDFIRTQVFPQNNDGMRFYERNGFCEMMKTIECQL
jgi:ribosomal protein S18 acetylase RimI-like enzyme